MSTWPAVLRLPNPIARGLRSSFGRLRLPTTRFPVTVFVLAIVFRRYHIAFVQAPLRTQAETAPLGCLFPCHVVMLYERPVRYGSLGNADSDHWLERPKSCDHVIIT